MNVVCAGLDAAVGAAILRTEAELREFLSIQYLHRSLWLAALTQNSVALLAAA